MNGVSSQNKKIIKMEPMIVILLFITVGVIIAADCSTAGGSASCAAAGNMAVSIYNDPVSIVENVI